MVDRELIAAIGAAAVSGVAAVISVWQARIAKGAARSAETQAQAAQEQVALMRRQIEGEEEARREARGPSFSPLTRGSEGTPPSGSRSPQSS